MTGKQKKVVKAITKSFQDIGPAGANGTNGTNGAKGDPGSPKLAYVKLTRYGALASPYPELTPIHFPHEFITAHQEERAA